MEGWFLVVLSVLGMIGGVIAYKRYVSRLDGITVEEDFLSRNDQEFKRFARKYGIIGIVLTGFMGIVTTRISPGVSADVPLFLAIVLLIVLFGLLSIYFMTANILRDPRSSAKVKKDMTYSMIIAAGMLIVFSGLPVGIFLGMIELSSNR